MKIPATPPTRIAAVDVLRGLTMAVMIVVNNPGTWSHMYPVLRHADWGAPLTPADLVFPMFIFLMGVSVPLALGPRREAGMERGDLLRRAGRRAGGLFLIGLGLNLFPEFDLTTLRVPGVLQRIAVVYLVCAAACLAGGPRLWLSAAITLLVGYTAMLLLVPVPGTGAPAFTPEVSLPVWLDELVLGRHSWRGPGDPEGLLSTLPAVASGLLGMVAGGQLRRKGPITVGASRLAVAGLAGLVFGTVGSRWHPAAKELWTATYVLITSGAALLALAGAWWMIDGQGRRRGLWPLQILGRHALGAFAAAHLVSDVTIRVLRWSDGDGGTLSLHHFVQKRLLATWLPPEAASLVQALLLLVAIGSVLLCREKRRLAVRVH